MYQSHFNNGDQQQKVEDFFFTYSRSPAVKGGTGTLVPTPCTSQPSTLCSNWGHCFLSSLLVFIAIARNQSCSAIQFVVQLHFKELLQLSFALHKWHRICAWPWRLSPSASARPSMTLEITNFTCPQTGPAMGLGIAWSLLHKLGTLQLGGIGVPKTKHMTS